MLYREVTAVCCGDHMNHIDTVCVKMLNTIILMSVLDL